MKRSVLLIFTFLCVISLSAQNTHRSSAKRLKEPSEKSTQANQYLSLPDFTVSDPVIYTNETEFLTAVKTTNCLEDFNNPKFIKPGLFMKADTTMDKPPFNYTIKTALDLMDETLYSGYYSMSHEVLEDTLLIINNNRHINYFGGYFFSTNQLCKFQYDTIEILVGNFKYIYKSSDSINFIGFVFTDTIPYFGFRGVNEGKVATSYATIDHLILGDNLNFAPVIKSTSPVTVDEDVPFTVTLSFVTATDVDGDTPVSITVVSGDNYTSLNNVVTPATNFNGTLQVGVKVSDGIAESAVAYIPITVVAVNDPPEIASTAPTTAKETTLYTYTVNATDIDNGTLLYSLSGQPSGMEINNNVITWTPATGITTSGEVTLTVSDGTLTDTEKFTISVTPLTDIDDKTDVNLSIRPNPTTSYVTVVSPSRITSAQVIDVTGKILLTRYADDMTLTIDEIESYPRGIYFVKVKTITETKVLKLIKQ